MQELLRLGAHVDHVDANMASALMLAASTGPLSVVKALVEHGADVNLQVGPRARGGVGELAGVALAGMLGDLLVMPLLGVQSVSLMGHIV